MNSTFFGISHSFIDWLLKKKKNSYTFKLVDDKYPHYDFDITVTVNDLRLLAQLQRKKEIENG